MSHRTGAIRGRRMLRRALFVVPIVCAAAAWSGCFPSVSNGDPNGPTKIIVTPPTIQITAPNSDLTLPQGSRFTTTWTNTDPNGDSLISIFLTTHIGQKKLVGDEILVVAGRQATPSGGVYSTQEIDTGALNLPVGNYQVLGLIQDSTGNSATSLSNGVIHLLPAGVTPTTPAPTIRIVEPAENLGVAHGDKVCLQWEADTHGKNATVTISLDYNLNPYDANTIVLGSRTVNTRPISLDPNLLLDPNYLALLDPNLTDPNVCKGSNQFQITIDAAGKTPARADGLPYFIQAKIDDGVNPPVYAYAPGWLTVQKWASGPSDWPLHQAVVDLRDTGEGLAGAILQGFHGKADPLDANQVGGWAGSSATSLGDLDGDGYEDFVVAARHSNPRGRGYQGEAYLVYGRKARLSSSNSLNSVGTSIRGAQFHAGHNWGPVIGLPGGNGGLASVSRTADLDFDGKPEIIFGFPDVVWYDYLDDDPLDEANLPYFDDLPPRMSDADPKNDDLGFHRLSCVVYVSSKNTLENNTIDLPMVGQRDPGIVSDDEGLLMPGSTQPLGARFRGELADFAEPDQYGETVSWVPDTNGDLEPDLLFSAPNGYGGRGEIQIQMGFDFTVFVVGNLSEQGVVVGDTDVKSFPIILAKKYTATDPNNSFGYRWYNYPQFHTVTGANVGDHLGRGVYAGDFNQDGSPDIACGAPDADRNGKTACGVSYIAFGQLIVGYVSIANHPRIEIVGTHSGDRLGETQGLITGHDPNHGDFNGDGIDDVIIGAQHYAVNGVADTGFAAVLFGGRQYTGERVFSVDDIATPLLPGVKFFGTKQGALAGAMVSSAGDFNGDGLADILICAPGAEYQFTAGGSTQTRLGVCYLIFGNPALTNRTFTLDQVGTAALPGIVFASPYEKGSADEAGVDTCFSIGDINGDGYSDILIGNTHADYVNPANPSQRRVDAGECYIIYGNNFGSNNRNSW
jgi:hypothetical protein